MRLRLDLRARAWKGRKVVAAGRRRGRGNDDGGGLHRVVGRSGDGSSSSVVCSGRGNVGGGGGVADFDQVGDVVVRVCRSCVVKRVNIDRVVGGVAGLLSVGRGQSGRVGGRNGGLRVIVALGDRRPRRPSPAKAGRLPQRWIRDPTPGRSPSDSQLDARGQTRSWWRWKKQIWKALRDSESAIYSVADKEPQHPPFIGWRKKPDGLPRGTLETRIHGLSWCQVGQNSWRASWRLGQKRKTKRVNKEDWEGVARRKERW
ncbi:hypothetical protein DFH06DRAFT_1188401 [Mycena polygramma]|nr:hypothetical protein DFH06DRAFT_1188401 [Mycena polygramma]